MAEITPIAFSTIGWRYFVVYACTNFLLILPRKRLPDISRPRTMSDHNIAVVYLFFPETSNLQLEEVDQIFRESKSIFHPVKVANGLPRRALRGRDGDALKLSRMDAEHRE